MSRTTERSFQNEEKYRFVSPNQTIIENDIKNDIASSPNKSLLSEQPVRRTVTFHDDDIRSSDHITNRSFRTKSRRISLSNINQNPNDKDASAATLLSPSIADTSNQESFNKQDSNNIIFSAEYIPGGFENLDSELQEEFFNSFDDEFDNDIVHRNRNVSKTHSIEHPQELDRSPIELWQRARILIAVHLYKIQTNRKQHISDNISSVIKRQLSNHNDQLTYFENIFYQNENNEKRETNFGISILQQILLDHNQYYHCIDYYDVEQGYIFVCNTNNSHQIKNEFDDQLNIFDKKLNLSNKFFIYLLKKTDMNRIETLEFDCIHEFHFIQCIPHFRLVLAFVNITKQKSLIILYGDVSRKCSFLSEQEINDSIYSVLYVHEISMLFLGCLGHVLVYNTQPFQFTSQPLFLFKFNQLPFQSNEPIIYLCQLLKYQSIGILSKRSFVSCKYKSNDNLIIKFPNPYHYEFIRCHFISKYDYIIFAFINGLLSFHKLADMKKIRHYQNHWNRITDLKHTNDENYLISSSIDHNINIYNLKTLQHVYRYNTNEEIIQIHVIDENLFAFSTLKQMNIFQLNLNTILFSPIKKKIKLLKLFTDTKRTARILALLDDHSSVIISPVSGACLTSIPNISKNPIKQVLHDISRSTIYSLEFNGEIIFYKADNNPCIAEYKIRSKSEQYSITCMTLINPIRTKLFNIKLIKQSNEKFLEKQIVFFGHSNGYISLFQGDGFYMEPLLAHKNSIICLETSQTSMRKSNVFLTNTEILLSSSTDRTIYLWDLNIDQTNDSIHLIHILTVEQEKAISYQSIKFLSMFDNFILANYTDQNYLHLWQVLNISIEINQPNQFGTVEHPMKGKEHTSQLQAISVSSSLKLFASSDRHGCIKIWDNTNSLLRDIYLDKSLYSIEFLSSNGELIFSYQDNVHLLLPEYYLNNDKRNNKNQTNINNFLAEENRLELTESLGKSYDSLPTFEYDIKKHHSQKRLQRFETQLAGRFVAIEYDSSESDNDNFQSSSIDHLSQINIGSN